VLKLKRRRGLRSGHSSRLGGPVGRHVAEAERPPPERHDSSGVILPHHFLQGDLSVPQVPQHGLVKLEHLLLLLLGEAISPVPL
jgi:hypothetical protein